MSTPDRRCEELAARQHGVLSRAQAFRAGMTAGAIAADALLESALEARLLRLLRRAGLPHPTPQHEVRSGGRVVARLDFAYPQLRLAIEASWHAGYERWRRDVRRENALKRLGWVVLVFTWDDVVDDPGRVVAEIRALLPEVLPKTAVPASIRGEPRDQHPAGFG